MERPPTALRRDRRPPVAGDRPGPAARGRRRAAPRLMRPAARSERRWGAGQRRRAAARARVHRAKTALGERGTPWWEQTPDERRARWEAGLPAPPTGRALAWARAHEVVRAVRAAGVRPCRRAGGARAGRRRALRDDRRRRPPARRHAAAPGRRDVGAARQHAAGAVDLRGRARAARAALRPRRPRRARPRGAAVGRRPARRRAALRRRAAGARGGQTVGTLCVFSPEPGTIGERQRAALDDLAAQVVPAARVAQPHAGATTRPTSGRPRPASGRCSSTRSSASTRPRSYGGVARRQPGALHDARTPRRGHGRAAVLDFFHADDPGALPGDLARCAPAASTYERERTYLHADGHPVPVHVQGVLIRDAGGRPDHIVGTVVDLTARRAAMAELADRAYELRLARDEALAADRAKSTFLTHVSHEIRTPLNGLLGMLELLQQTELDDVQRERAGVAQASGQLLMQLLNDVLDLSKGEALETALHPRPLQLAGAAAQVVDAMRPVAEAKGVPLCCGSRGPAAAGRGRPRPAAPAAAQPGRQRGQVHHRRLGHRRPAAGPRGRPVVGRRHRSRHRPRRRRAAVPALRAGAGGRAARRHGARPRAVPPAGRPHGRHPRGAQRARCRAAPSPPRCRSWRPRPRSRRPRRRAPRAATGTLRVLLVDDGAVNRMVGVALLESLGAVVETAEDGWEALHAVRVGDYDVVLMDCHMPGLDGLAATRALRATHPTRLPVYALTADASGPSARPAARPAWTASSPSRSAPPPSPGCSTRCCAATAAATSSPRSPSARSRARCRARAPARCAPRPRARPAAAPRDRRSRQTRRSTSRPVPRPCTAGIDREAVDAARARRRGSPRRVPTSAPSRTTTRLSASRSPHVARRRAEGRLQQPRDRRDVGLDGGPQHHRRVVGRVRRRAVEDEGVLGVVGRAAARLARSPATGGRRHEQHLLGAPGAGQVERSVEQRRAETAAAGRRVDGAGELEGRPAPGVEAEKAEQERRPRATARRRCHQRAAPAARASAAHRRPPTTRCASAARSTRSSGVGREVTAAPSQCRAGPARTRPATGPNRPWPSGPRLPTVEGDSPASGRARGGAARRGCRVRPARRARGAARRELPAVADGQHARGRRRRHRQRLHPAGRGRRPPLPAGPAR